MSDLAPNDVTGPAISEQLPALPAGSKVLITGAAGFLGSRLRELLAGQSDIEIVGLIRRKPMSDRLPANMRFVTGGMLDREAVATAMADAQYVFHCAYDPSDPPSNIHGTEMLLNEADRARVARFVHVSTFAVYQPFPADVIDETTADGDRSIAYVDAKLTLEDMVLQRTHVGDLHGTVIQPAIVYGPGCWAWSRAPVELLQRGNVVLPYAGSGRCNLVYVDDVVQAMVRSAIVPKSVGCRFLVAGTEELRWRDYYNAIATELGLPGPIAGDVPEPGDDRRSAMAGWLERRLPARLARRLARLTGVRSGPNSPPPELDNMFACRASVDIGLARALLDYRPAFDLATGLKAMRAYHQRLLGRRRAA